MKKGQYTYDYPRPAVTTDCVVFGFDGHDLKILLIERGIEPYKGAWAFPGGFLNMDETAGQGALRELREETGLDLNYLKQVGAFSDVDRDPRTRVITIAFYALAKKSEVQGGDDAAKAQWFALNEVPRLAFDHDYILRKTMEKLRKDIHFEPIGFGLLDKEFTMSELQRLYEAILGVQFDRRNFYKKMLQTGILDEVDDILDDDSSYYGKNKEMRKMDIGALFSKSLAAEPVGSYSCRSADEDRPSSRRWGTKYRFNEKRYRQFKEDNSFRLEF
jgi:8-oxo-dGTP diphosphatase